MFPITSQSIYTLIEFGLEEVLHLTARPWDPGLPRPEPSRDLSFELLASSPRFVIPSPRGVAVSSPVTQRDHCPRASRETLVPFFVLFPHLSPRVWTCHFRRGRFSTKGPQDDVFVSSRERTRQSWALVHRVLSRFRVIMRHSSQRGNRGGRGAKSHR